MDASAVAVWISPSARPSAARAVSGRIEIGKTGDQPFPFNEEGNPFVSGLKGGAAPR
jgi:hypothetical protein